MREVVLLLLLGSVFGLEYHPRMEFTRHIELQPNSSKTFLIKSTELFAAHFVDSKTSLCFDAQLTNPLETRLWNGDMTISINFNIKKNGLTLVKPIFNAEKAMASGVNVTVGGNHAGVSGNITLKRCKIIEYASLYDGIMETSLEQYDPWDSTIRIPFYVTDRENATSYVDFSSILPRRALFDTEYTRTAFCINTTINGKIDVYMSRCKSREPFKMSLTSGDHRQIERKHPWEEFILPKNRCPIHEAELPDHLHFEIASSGHSGAGEIVIYNCHHQFVTAESGYGEVVKMRPVLDYEESGSQNFFYTIMPYRRNTYFAPMKHMMDSALLLGNIISYAFVHNIPVSVSFSACYNSSRYKLKVEFIKANIVANLTTEEIQMLSEYSRFLDCPEEKRHGFYIHFGADKHMVTDGMRFWSRNMQGAITPAGKLRNDRYTTVAFNLNKGDVISRNVNLRDLLKLAERNAATKFNMYFNATGQVQLSVSRCKYSPRYKLFKAAKLQSLIVSDEIVNYMMELYDKNDCISDLQVERYEYRGWHRGIYLHVEPLENTTGYIAPYLTYEKKMTWHQLNEEHQMPKHERGASKNTYVFPGVVADVMMEIPHLIERVRKLGQNSFRFYIHCTGPCEFGFTKCETDEVQEWKKITPLNNISNGAWYTFDRPAVEYLHALSESPDCERKNGAQLFVKLRSDQKISSRVEFSVVDGIDLNQLDPCHTAENVKLRELDLQYKFYILLVEIAMVVVALLGIGTGFAVGRMCNKSKKMDDDNDDAYQMISIASTSTIV